jgi:hypothetical protein
MMALRQRAEDHPIRYFRFILSLPNTRTHQASAKG